MRLLPILLILSSLPAFAQDHLLVRFANERAHFSVQTWNAKRDLREYLKRGDVLYAEVDRTVPPAYLPNDPSLPNQWHIAKIAAPLAWDKSNGDGVILAIIDTGCAVVPDLSRTVAGWNLYSGNFDTSDVYGHGTSTAGTALAVGDNLIGVAGVGYGATLMPIRVSAPDGTATYGRAALAIRYAADHGARVANVSYQMSESLAVQDAALYGEQHGMVTVISAGNGGTTSTVPNALNILTVGSTGGTDARSSWTVRGSIVDLYAPGESILTTDRGGGYSFHSGTSFSSPVVAGVAALCFAYHPQWTAQACMYAITSTCDVINGVPRVNAQRAVNAVILTTQDPPDTEAPTVAILAPSNGYVLPRGNGNLQVVVDATDDRAVAKVDLYVDGVLEQSDTAEPWTFQVNTKRWTKGQHVITIRAADGAGNLAAAAVTVTK